MDYGKKLTMQKDGNVAFGQTSMYFKKEHLPSFIDDGVKRILVISYATVVGHIEFKPDNDQEHKVVFIQDLDARSSKTTAKQITQMKWQLNEIWNMFL